MAAPVVVLGMVLTVAVYLELKESRIPNWLTLTGMSIGLLLGYLPGGLTFPASLLGLCVGFGFLFLFYVFGGIGGGDVKLMGAVGALLGGNVVGHALFYTAVIGGFMAVTVLIWRGGLWLGVRRGVMRLFKGKRLPESPDDTTPAATVPYGLAIAAGSLLALLLSTT